MGRWRPVLFLALSGRALGYRIPLPILICDAHRSSIARLFVSRRGRAHVERALGDRVSGARPNWRDTVLLFSSVTTGRAGAVLHA